jgi:hypothetical protein
LHSNVKDLIAFLDFREGCVCFFSKGAVHVLLESSGVCTLDVICFLILDSYVLLEKNIADC